MIAFEESVPGCFPYAGQLCNVVPESDQLNAQSSLFQAGAETFDLSALACPVDAGKTHQPGWPLVLGCTHALAPNYTLSVFVQCGLLELAAERATTVPMATPAAAMSPTLIRIERDRFCFAGAIAAPAGLDAGTPVTFSYGAAAVPTGSWGAVGCCCGAVEPVLPDGVWAGEGCASGPGVALSEVCDGDCAGAVSTCCGLATTVSVHAASKRITRQRATGRSLLRCTF